MFGIGFSELIVIAIVALIFVGPKRLPEVMKQAGKLFVHVRRTANDVKGTFDQVVREAENEVRKEEADQMRQLMTGTKPVTTVKAIDAGIIDGGQPMAAHTPVDHPAEPHPEGHSSVDHPPAAEPPKDV